MLSMVGLCRKRIAQENRLRNLLTWLMKEENMGRREYVEAGLNICQKLAMSGKLFFFRLEFEGKRHFIDSL
jgi:tRNA splicing ligase